MKINITPKLHAYMQSKGYFGGAKAHGSTIEPDADYSEKDYHNDIKDALADGDLTEVKFLELTADDDEPVTSDSVFGGKSANRGSANVKAPSEMYSDVTFSAKHAKTGRPVRGFDGRQVDTLSDRTTAKLGTWFKWLASRTPDSNILLNEHEKNMVAEMFDSKTRWVGDMGGEYRADWNGSQAKAALLSDNTSGGVNSNPYFVDDALVTFPLLNGEIFPYVSLVEMSHGTTTFGASIGNPTVTYTGAESATNTTLFDSTGLISSLDTTVYPMMLSLNIGRDYLADQVFDVGRQLVEIVGKRHAAELDKLVATGSGSNQATGIINTSGVGTFPNIASGVGPLSAGDLEGLMFAVAKQYRNRSYRPCFISNDATYRRVRAIPRGSDDAQRLFGMDEQSYTVLDQPYRISNDLADNYLVFGCMERYRFYRRMGVETRWETAGYNLALSNSMLLVMRARYGGRVMDTNAFIMETNAPTSG